MRRPKAPRRLRAGALDRRAAAGIVTLASIVLLVTVSVASAPLPEVARHDPGAARDLVALMRAGEQGRWIVTHDFVRTLANGRVLPQTMHEGRVPSLHVLISGTSMTLEQPDGAYNCNVVGTRSECTKSAAGSFLPASEVMRIAVNAGAYDVTRRGAVTIAGERARCFRVVATERGYLPDIGVESDLCFAPDGISLQQRIERSAGDVDERTARTVTRGVRTSAVEEMARGFDGG